MTEIESPYTVLALIYDNFMEATDFDLWAEFIRSKIQNLYRANPRKILELASGTGAMTEALLKVFPESKITGLDVSRSMLKIAEERLSKFPPGSCKFINSSMENLRKVTAEKYDLVVLVNSSISYLTSMKEVSNLFKEVFQVLRSGGIFYFDIASDRHIKEVFQNAVFIEEGPLEENLSRKIMGKSYRSFYCVWSNEYDESTGSVAAIYDIFLEENSSGKSTWERFQEVHPQKIHKPSELKRELVKAGFKRIKVFKNYQQKGKDFRGFNFFTQKI